MKTLEQKVTVEDFTREKTIEGVLFPGENPSEISESQDNVQHDFFDHLETRLSADPCYSLNFIVMHSLDDRRGVDAVNRTYIQNLAWLIREFNLKTQSDIRINVLLAGKGFSRDSVEKFWRNESLDDIISYDTLDIDPDNRLKRNQSCESIWNYIIESSKIGTLISTKAAEFLQDKSEFSQTIVLVSNPDLSIVSPVTGGFLEGLKQIEDIRRRTKRDIYFVSDIHDAFEDHGPLRQSDHKNINDFISDLEKGEIFFKDYNHKKHWPYIENLVSWSKTGIVDLAMTLNAVNWTAFQGKIPVRVNPFGRSFLNETELIEKSYNEICEYVEEDESKSLKNTAEEILGIRPDFSQEHIRGALLETYEQTVRNYFSENGYHFDQDKGIVVYFAGPDIRKNLSTFILHSEILGYNGIVTLKAELPEEKTKDGILSFILDEFVKEFGFSVSFGYGYDRHKKKGHISSQDDERRFSSENIEWSRIDILGFERELAVDAMDPNLERFGRIYGSNMTATQEGFGLPYVECTSRKTPFVHFQMTPAMNNFFIETMGIDLTKTQYPDLFINTNDSSLKDYRKNARDFIENTMQKCFNNSQDPNHFSENRYRDLMLRLSPEVPEHLNENFSGLVGFAGLDLASQLGYLLFAKDHAYELQNLDYFKNIREKLDPKIVKEESENFYINEDTSGLLIGALFMPEYRERINGLYTMDSYSKHDIDYAIKKFEELSPR
ncbi:hypothetical protein GF327_05985 [Candidatus Woesearchaeota archaeon]|nr:hypothetical protein [Candidatus Woesearchaeota archaeon]